MSSRLETFDDDAVVFDEDDEDDDTGSGEEDVPTVDLRWHVRGKVREGSGKKALATRKREAPLAELYDPDADDKDERQLEKKIAKYFPGGEVASDGSVMCACCFSLLSRYTQQHERKINQFRAVFVQNCRVDLSQGPMRYRRVPAAVAVSKSELKRRAARAKRQQRKANKRRGATPTDDDDTFAEEDNEDEEGEEDEEDEDEGSAVGYSEPVFVRNIVRGQEAEFDEAQFFPVFCMTCGTDVAVIDADEVYHFYNVAPSL